MLFGTTSCYANPNFADSHVNDALSAGESVDPDDLDRIALNVKAHMDAFAVPADRRRPAFGLCDPPKHPDHSDSKLVCKMWDLEAAYRQLARSPAHAPFTVVAVWDPAEGTHKYFTQPVLAFGAAASVYASTWVAAAL